MPSQTRPEEQFPGLNVLINDAGISKPEDLTLDTIDVTVPRSIIQTNILGVFYLTARLLPTLKQRPNATLITTTSGLAFVPRATFQPTAPARRFFTPGCSRSDSSFGTHPWRSSSWPRRWPTTFQR